MRVGITKVRKSYIQKSADLLHIVEYFP